MRCKHLNVTITYSSRSNSVYLFSNGQLSVFEEFDNEFLGGMADCKDCGKLVTWKKKNKPKWVEILEKQLK